MEVATSPREAKSRPRDSPTDPRGEPGQSTLGHPEDSWRTSQGLVGSTAPSTPNPLAGSDGAPDGRMDRSSTDRGLRLGACAEISHPRSRPRLWRGIQTADSGDGDSRPTHRATIAMAERTRRTADRLDPKGMP